MCFGYSFAQNNLLDFPQWNVGPAGSGYTTGYSISGTSAENSLEEGPDPYGGTSVLWKASPDDTDALNGGFYTSSVTIDGSKTYRFSIWLKKTGTQTGKSYFGLHARDGSDVKNTLNFDNSVNTNPYFWADDLPTLDEWYLVVAFIHEDGYVGSTNHSDTGVYAADGTKMGGITITDFKFSPTSVKLQLRAYLNYDTVLSDNQFFYSPAIHEINGQEPTIQELIDPSGGNATSLWTENGGNIHYDGGNVGIGTNANPNFMLAVDGKIIAEEVRVELSGNWPDYVFEKGYDLPTLDEIKKHIEEKGHLPNIPSTKEVKANGIELGEMNRLLLEKIEELTLYILSQERKLEKLNHHLNQYKGLEQRIKQLELNSVQSPE
ncbi:MAG: hypothetical protein CMH48_11465 [Muricauda sp.]|nr:hypothetical protein [Allomuricauda sp.]